MKNQPSENRREFIRKASKIVHEWNVHLEILSRPQAKENSRQCLLLRTDIIQKTVAGCPWVLACRASENKISNVSKWSFPGSLYFENTPRKNVRSNLVLVVAFSSLNLKFILKQSCQTQYRERSVVISNIPLKPHWNLVWRQKVVNAK